MIKVIRQGVYYMDGRLVKESEAFMTSDKKEAAEKNTVTYSILSAHSKSMGKTLALKPDAALLCDETDVLRTLDFVGMKEFPLPTYLFEGYFDGDFLRSAAKNRGGAFLPEDLGDMGAFAREQVAKSGQLFFASNEISCGALGAMVLWKEEGNLLRLFTKGSAEEPCRALLALYLKGKLRKGVGPTDVALAVLQALEKAGNFTEEKYLEVFGAGVSGLSMDYRNALDNALGSAGIAASVWATDEKTREYFETHLRAEDFKSLAPLQPAYYDGAIVVDLSDIEPMIGAEGNITTVREFLSDPPAEYLKEGRVFLPPTAVDAAYATYETVAEMAEILREKQIGGEISCSVLQHSKPVTLALAENGYLGVLLRAGVDLNRPLSSEVRCLDTDFCFESILRLDARTIAASLANGGQLTSALGLDYPKRVKKYKFDPAPYLSRVINDIGKPQKGALAYDEEVAPLPEFPPLPENLQLSVDGEEGDLAVVIGDLQDYAWSYAVEDRERGAFAALAKNFPEKLRTHLIDWGILPLVYEKFEFKDGDILHLEKIAEHVKTGEERIVAKVVGKRRTKDIVLSLGKLSEEERKILLAGGKNNLVRKK